MLCVKYFSILLIGIILLLQQKRHVEAEEVAEEVTEEDIEPRIIGGKISSIDEEKYLVQVINGDELCGGSLVQPKWVITAAHCVKGMKMENFRIYGGASNIKGKNAVMRLVDFVMAHPKFTFKTLNMDVAAIRLKQPMVGNNIETIDLTTYPVKPRSMVKVAGWGVTNPNSEQLAKRVHTMRVPVWRRASCIRAFVNVQRITKSMMCAGQLRKRDACSGDSGGPVTYEGKLVGIVSWGNDCANNFPGVYTNVAVIRDWFMFIVNSNL